MKKEKNAVCRRTSVGGQAVIEGVMMKNGTEVSLAIRKADGTIEISKSEFHPAKEKHKWLNIPILRGIVGFVESMILSLKTMGTSTDMLGLDELEEQEKKEKEAKKAKKRAEKEARKQGKTPEQILAEKSTPVDEIEPKKEEKKSSGALSGAIMAISMVLGLALAVLLFIALPTFVTNLIDIPVKKHISENGMNQYLKAGIEGVIKILIFIIYIASVALMKDIKRTFAYHGAEHKSIACYEAGMDLTPENARKCSRFHPRCGTSFLFVMILLGIIVGMFIPEFESMPWLRIALKLTTLPIIMGLGYEFIMIAGKHPNWLTRALSAPGLWMQRLTTKEPDDYQLAVAICALKSSMPNEFPDFEPNEYFITPEQNKGHLMYEEKKSEQDKEITKKSENTTPVDEN
jgi:uncharacterized protein YqhQ